MILFPDSDHHTYGGLECGNNNHKKERKNKMDNSKENILRVVRKIKSDYAVLKESTDNVNMENMYSGYIQAYQEIIWFLTDKQYFNDVADIYELK